MSIFPDISDIKLLREKLGLSQSELSKAVGITQSAIAKYEGGLQIPSYTVAVNIFNYLLEQVKSDEHEVKMLMEPSVISVRMHSKFGSALKLMKKYGISQIPVIENGRVYGTVTDDLSIDLLDRIQTTTDFKDTEVEECMREILPIVPPNASLRDINPLLRKYNAVLIQEREKVIGILTKMDLLDIRM